MILVTGATGTVGSEVVRQLLAAGQPVRVLVRPGSAGPKLSNGAEIAVGDAGRPETIEAALRGVERLYLLLPMTPALRQQDAGIIAAAQRVGVRLVVKHSNMGAQDEAGTTMQRWHRAGEMLIEKSGMAWTFIRPTGYMTNALGWAGMIKSQGAVYAPGGDGRLAVADPRDIAAVAVAALTGPGHEGRAYDVTGPEALSAAGQVKTISDEIGEPVTYIDIPETAAREQMISTGMPAEIAAALTEFMADVRAGRSATVSDAVMKITGHPARTFAAWAHENAAAFQ
jgi:(4-alkanoyl-5-oxo-2,5-dihydrofuran-3-yl)methyl phosphate reductase